MSDKDVLKGLLDFQREVVFWGSDNVIRSYLDMKEELEKFSMSRLGETQESANADGLAGVFRKLAELIVAMRKDVGYSFTTFSASDLARLLLSNDADTQKVKARLFE